MGKTSMIHLADLAGYWLSQGKITKAKECLIQIRKELDELDTMAYRKAMRLAENSREPSTMHN